MKALRFGSLIAGAMALAGLAMWWALPGPAGAHCDTLDGPVVRDARAALEKTDVKPALKWVRKENLDEVIAAFTRTVAVRSLNPEARELADRWFFETLVRLHRTGEGASFDGLKPAGSDSPAVKMADRAFESHRGAELAGGMAREVDVRLNAMYRRLVEAWEHKDESVEAGRAYAAAYVEYVHFVEALYNLVNGPGPGDHHGDGGKPAESGHGEGHEGH